MSRLWWTLVVCIFLAASSSQGWASVDAFNDCPGIIGDGSSDDWAALQTCLNSHPSEHVVLRHGRYYLSRPLVLMGNSQWLEGEAPAQYLGSTKLIFSIDSVGIQIPPTCYACKLTNLEIDSAACVQGLPPIWNGPLNGAGVDGIQVGGAEVYIANVRAACFTRHGIHISGDRSLFPDQPGVALNEPDFWRLDDVAAYRNGGDGFFVTGADSNAGVGDLVIATGNGLWGVDDNSMLGNNVWNMIGTHANRTGTIRSRAGAPSSTFIDPYCEMGQGSSQIQGRAMVIGGNCSDSETNWQAPFLTVAGLTFNVYSQGGMNINSPTDTAAIVTLKAGRTNEQRRGVVFMRLHEQDKQFEIFSEEGITILKDYVGGGEIVFNRNGSIDIETGNGQPLIINGQTFVNGQSPIGNPTVMVMSAEKRGSGTTHRQKPKRRRQIVQ